MYYMLLLYTSAEWFMFLLLFAVDCHFFVIAVLQHRGILF